MQSVVVGRSAGGSAFFALRGCSIKWWAQSSVVGLRPTDHSSTESAGSDCRSNGGSMQTRSSDSPLINFCAGELATSQQQSSDHKVSPDRTRLYDDDDDDDGERLFRALPSSNRRFRSCRHRRLVAARLQPVYSELV